MDGPEPGVAAVVVTDHTIDSPNGPCSTGRVAGVGVGASKGAPAAEIGQLIDERWRRLGGIARSVRHLATVEAKADEPGLLAAAAGRAGRWSPSPPAGSPRYPCPTRARWCGRGRHAERRRGGGAGRAGSCCWSPSGQRARHGRRGPGPAAGQAGGDRYRAGRPGPDDPRAMAELRRAAVVAGLDAYLDQVADLLRPGTRVLASGLGAEQERAAEAVAQARAGRAVALIGSATRASTRWAARRWSWPARDRRAGARGHRGAGRAAVLGAPLGHDHVMICCPTCTRPGR